MAWFYNHVLTRFFEIGLVMSSRRLYGPPRGYVPNFAFLLRNSQISNFAHVAKHQKPHFPMACLSLNFRGIFGVEKRQFGLF
jgi:hypothetical protein